MSRKPLCGCGCGQVLTNPRRRFIQGHDTKVRGSELTRPAQTLNDAELHHAIDELLRAAPTAGWRAWRALGVLALERSVRLARAGADH